jgi:levanase/fructan beta-fructosidase
LTLHATPDGLRLFRRPVREVESLQRAPDTWTKRTLQERETLPLEPSGECFRLVATVAIPDAARLTFRLRGQSVVLTAQTLESGAPPAALEGRARQIEILLDRASIEVFVNDGELSSTRFVLPTDAGLSLTAEGGPVTIESLVIHPLASAWPDAPDAIERK